MAAVVELSKKDKPKRVVKTKIEPIGVNHIVEIWRLIRESQLEGAQPYPDTTEESPEVIQSHLFAYLTDPRVTGLIARNGKKPVGLIMGRVVDRPYGSPKRFAFIWCFWVTPEARKSTIGSALWKDYTARLKAAQIFHWEAQCHDELEKYLVRSAGIPVKKLMSVIGGRL